MFEIPDAKRVRREQLYDSSSERHSSPEADDEETAALRAKLNARLSGLLSLNIPPPTAAPAAAEDLSALNHHPQAEEADDDNDHKQPGEKEQAEFEFRLFSTPAVTTATTTDATAGAAQPPPLPKVVLVPDEVEEAYDGPAISRRPLSCYIRGELSTREREQFQVAAVSGRDVLAWAAQRAWGLEVPWRVTRVTVSVGKIGGKGTASAVVDRGEGGGEGRNRKKTRPGKKKRIVLRKRDKIKKEKEAEAEKLKMSKEEHLREKKKRLNREKKLKRRQKEREKKMAAKGAAAGGQTGAADSASEGSDGEE
ncbi:hypothetical protein C7999DRAFT_38775 [Corynascus novoguineensis]|uniref:Uncharacterized protein n=1 Tax=Corynascus novoguineensis TaxID=1126955 RepID=A0AAN7HSW3_9PEZI|nr:hypothetical protein C7999DRAFT_38775 [Corynascus novoguineensis]